MVDMNSWIIPCKKCGKKYEIPNSKITILSLNMIELEEESKCPLCGTPNSIAILKDHITGQ